MQMPENRILTAIGLMSGTSMDGIDVAILRTDGSSYVENLFSAECPYDNAFKQRLQNALGEAKSLRNASDRTKGLRELETEITRRHAKAVKSILVENGLTTNGIDLVGFHGQTVLHRPDQGFTVQLGDGAALADMVSIPVVYDMRANDMANGGQGAPLVPVYHQALAASLPRILQQKTPIAFVNIGGISNITYVGENDELIAFDTGPGNTLIDQWVSQGGGPAFDEDGSIAARGRVVDAIVEQYLAAPFFQQPIPKSLDRSDFSPLPGDAASLGDGARTLAFVSAAAIMKSCDHLPKPPKLWIVCGGGRKNPHIMADMKTLADEKNYGEVVLAEEAGLNGGAIEAEAWAYLAVRSVRKLPLTFPETTGCKKPVSGGILAGLEKRKAVS
jgi:anhydro-N-acetylmuramic acid kinase